jgi:sterol desaturase/sphingolipid hydroxylase (fatty acid hydroxylase superfamily)
VLLAYRDVLASVVVLTVVFYALEQLIPAERFQRLADRTGNWLYMPLITIWVFALQVVLRPLYAYPIAITRGGLWSHLGWLQTTVLGQVLLTLTFAVLWDVWQYWMHRWQHSSPVLWETHKFHHSDTALNCSAQARHHALSYLLYAVTYAPMLLIFGAFAPHAVASVLMFRVWGFVNHANVRIGFGPLTTLLAGPQWHRIHHSVHPHHMDRNFAALFPFIDRLFGTYYEPAPDEYPATGLPGDGESMLRHATISPLVVWYTALQRTLRRRNAFGAEELGYRGVAHGDPKNPVVTPRHQ